VQGGPPSREERSGGLEGSHHSRLIDELRAPLESHDEERAAEICGEICRTVLRDFAPALILLTPDDRRRAQALATYVVTLFDFARQTGVEGERLAAINRWEFTLESALDGAPPGQPAFVLMSATEKQKPWSRGALDEIARAARGRAINMRPKSVEQHRTGTEQLAGSLIEALTGQPSTPATRRHFGALVRLFALLELDDSLRRGTPAIPSDELPDHWHESTNGDGKLAAALEALLDRISQELSDPRVGIAEVPPSFRRAALYCGLAARGLLEKGRSKTSARWTARPLGAAQRIALIARARVARV